MIKLIAIITILLITGCHQDQDQYRYSCTKEEQIKVEESIKPCLRGGHWIQDCYSSATRVYCTKVPVYHNKKK